MTGALEGGLIVSCPAPVGSPLARPEIMAAMAQAAEMGGAAGIRAGGADNIKAIRRNARCRSSAFTKFWGTSNGVYIRQFP